MAIYDIKDRNFYLESGILEENFGRMGYSQIIGEEGILAKGIKNGENYSFTYEPWKFSEIKSFEKDNNSERMVYYCGKTSFFSENTRSLAEFLKDDKVFDAGFAVISAITQALKEEKNLPAIGAGGIFLELSKDEAVVLFLPEGIFEAAIAGLNQQEKSELHENWINPTLEGMKALCFIRSTVAYKMLTGRFPYPATDSIERNADILDGKFLPVELAVNGIDSKLAYEINNSLVLNSVNVEIPGKKNRKKQKYIRANPDFPMELLVASKNPKETDGVSEDEFRARAESFMKKKDSVISAKRKMRRNVSLIVTSAIIITTVALITANSIKSNGNNFTSRGLTAEETVEGFFMGVNSLDTALLTSFTHGKTPRRYTDIVSQIYVIGRNRTAYGAHDKGFLNPSAYFIFLGNDSETSIAGLYGITNLKISGKSKNMNLKLPVLKDKPAPITEDKGIPVENKMHSVQTIEYDIIHSEGSDVTLFCEHHTDTFTLTFDKNRWIITEIKSDQYDVTIDSVTFMREYFAAFADCNNDAVAAVKQLKTHYPWLPSENDMNIELERQRAEQIEMLKMYGQYMPQVQ